MGVSPMRHVGIFPMLIIVFIILSIPRKRESIIYSLFFVC